MKKYEKIMQILHKVCIASKIKKIHSADYKQAND